MTMPVRRVITLVCILCLLAGFVLGICASEVYRMYTKTKSPTEHIVQKYEEILGLTKEQKEKLRTALEGNREKIIRALKENENNLNPWARERIAKIRSEIDYIIQNEILTEEQLKKYWELRNQGFEGR